MFILTYSSPTTGNDRRIAARMDSHDWVPGVSVNWWTCRCGWATTDPQAAAEHENSGGTVA